MRGREGERGGREREREEDGEGENILHLLIALPNAVG